MIISRTPLRISLGGGGTDLPAYYRNNGGGFLVAAAITRHIHIAVHENFADRYLLKYSEIENVGSVDEISHPLIREAARMMNTPARVEISSMADIPAGTGLGSSGTFAVGLLKALHAYQHKYSSNEAIAEMACSLEIDVLGEPVGKQDQYIAAIGGVTAFEFHDDDRVSVQSVPMSQRLHQELGDRLMLFYTGTRRSASEELRALDTGASVGSSSIKQNLDEVREAGRESFEILASGDIDAFGALLTQQWRLKLARSPSAIHRQVDEWIERGLQQGAVGGKLVGAGGGGFLLFLASDKARLRAEMDRLGLREVHTGIDYEGAVIGSA